MIKILVIAAHPDDEIIGMGGTITKLIEKGVKVEVLYLSSGDSQQKVREKEAKAVADFLKIRRTYFMRLFDQDFVFNQTNVAKLIAYYRKIKPGYLYINHENDADSEHKIAYQLVTESHWRYNKEVWISNRIKGLFFYEVHTPMEDYDVTEDVSKVMEKKISALRLYKSQLKLLAMDGAIKGLNRFRGEMDEQCQYAEVFQVKKLKNVSDLLSETNYE